MKPIPSINKICLIVNYNLYESKRYFTEKLAVALDRKGIQILVIDVKENAMTADVVRQIMQFTPDLTASFNTLMPFQEKLFLWDILKIPHWSIFLDPAMYSTDLTQSPYSILSCVDRDDCALLRGAGFDRTFFWPHAVEKELLQSGNVEKEFEVVFLGSCYDYESLRVSWRQQNNEKINQLLDDAIDIFFSNAQTSLAAALAQSFQAMNISADGVDFPSLFYYLDNYTRGKDRVELIRSVKEANVHVFGALSDDNAVGILGWSPYLAACKNVTVHPAVPFNEGLLIQKRAKIALNSMPFFKNGSHERVITALSCGALPVTTDTQFFRESFQEDKEIVFYQTWQRENVNEKINFYLNNESLRRQIVEQGSAVVAKNFTWDLRAAEALEAVNILMQKIHADQRVAE